MVARKVDPAQLAEQWAAGVPTRAIAAGFGCSATAVTTMAMRLGLPSRGPVPRVEVDMAALARLWAGGGTIDAIAAELEVTPARVARLVREAGLPRRPHPGRRPRGVEGPPGVDWARLRALWEAGASTGEIAADLGCSTSHVEELRRRLGLSPRPVGGRLARGGRVDTEALPRLWAEGIPTREIAERMGVRPPAVTRAAAILGLPSKGKPGSGRKVGHQLKAAERAPVPRTYAEIMAAAAAAGLTATQAMQRFHRERAARGRGACP